MEAMPRVTSRIIGPVIFGLLLAAACFAQTSVRVMESKARIEFHANGTHVILPLENQTDEIVTSTVHLELIDPSGVIEAESDRNVSVPVGSTNMNLDLPPVSGQNERLNRSRVLWYRLRYAINASAAKQSKLAPIVGILSVSEATPDIFELHVAAPALAREGSHYAVRVRAIHPVTGHPVAGVSVQASLDLDADNGKPLVTRAAATDRRGFATLEFPLPEKVNTDEIDVNVKGTFGDFSADANGSFHVNHFSSVALSTDKSIYQPGQTLHTRLMAFGVNKKAIAGGAVILKIFDPEETLVTRIESQTSRFGIASADWQIPDNLRLGTYRIQANFGEGRYEDSSTSATVKISRYELPSFTVTAKPDRAYYLPNQEASIEIQADYLFGEPVQHGHVRVVRETAHKWNYREQKWEIDEGEKYEGDTNEQGRYVVKVDLSKDHAQLERDDYERFRDLKFAAYYTDSSTGRTEQRRFDLRVTKDPIHVYVIEPSQSTPQGIPLEMYLSTDYADGSPAQCDVEISWVDSEQRSTDGFTAPPLEQPLRHVRTNRYGVAKVSGLTVPDHANSGRFSLSFRARDHQGEVGQHTESMWSFAHSGIRVETDKTLYKAGESIAVQLVTSKPDTTVVVEAVHDSEVLASKLVHVRHGHASASFEASDKFQNEVSILAYVFGRKPGDDYYHSATVGSHTVLFPKNRELKVNVKMAKSIYRPGEEATADVRIGGADGEPAKSVLGLVVVDKAVEERERTDREFGEQGGFYNFRDLWSETSELNGVHRRDLDKIDMTKPVADGLELLAEVLLQGNALGPETFASDSGETDLNKLFASEINPTIQPIRAALDLRYEQKREYPRTEPSLERYLLDAGCSLQSAKDPWGTPYRPSFSVVREADVLEISSAGPDKTFGTEDDFVVAKLQRAYFKPNYDAIRRSVNEYHDRTGGFIRDFQTLKSELARRGIDSEALRDPWEHGYQFSFGIDRTQFTVTVTSAGPDGQFGTKANPSDDDFSLATIGIDYFAEVQTKLDAALTTYFTENQLFPENLDQLQKALQHSGLHWDALGDAWGHAYYATFRQEARYSDDLALETYEQHERKEARSNIVPVTQRINWIYIRSAGEDGIEGTSDDFDVATFSRGVLAQSSKDKAPISTRAQTVLAGSSGAISGQVADPSGATLASAEISAKNQGTGIVFTAKTDNEGGYLLRNLPPGFYVVQFSASGFQSYAITDVPVRSSSVTHLNARLQLGSVSQTVEVSAEAVPVQTTSSMVATVTKSGTASLALPSQLSTPRLREYFPETLLWQPELVTDDNGHAQLKFSLADNITTWKLSAVASTVNGEMGTAEKDIRAFQPFFVEHDPPRFLTVGDEIALPVILRNYLERRLPVKVAMKSAPWFLPLGPTSMKTEVAPRDVSRDIFSFRAVSAIKEGKQEVSASGADASDAISRSVTVRPDGEEQTVSATQVFDDATSLDLIIPDTAISGSVGATLKIYPNLTAHVLEGIAAILERPYGCGEQTISSTYPSILLLKHAQKSGLEKTPLVARARRYTQLGYQRLLSYRAPSGGFSYWGRGDADLALTVYAIKFLSDASEFVAVDDSVLQESLSWVLNQSQPDGHWEARDWKGNEDTQRSVMLTAYIALMIVNSKLELAGLHGNLQIAKSALTAARRALTYLQRRVEGMDEPYVISSYALAALGVGDESRFNESVERLRKLEHKEGDSSYWSLEMNTPFYGWGQAGRLETTALVLQTLARSSKVGDLEAQKARGLLFLLRNQDRYGIWYSTQATINVLDAMSALTSPQGNGTSDSGNSMSLATKALVFVDGEQTVAIDLPPGNVLSGPVQVELPKFVSSGKHRIEIHRPTGSSRASLQILADYYVPWTPSVANGNLYQDAKLSDALQLFVHFDKQSANVLETVQCSVDAERIGFRGYGMMLAEIGLPPGAEVDRSSLQRAMEASGWDINEFNVLPDKVVVYLWPHAGGTKFSFTFKPRFAMRALSAPSILYDYYNPEAQATVAPTPFVVR
jgi:hypothetical protein